MSETTTSTTATQTTNTQGAKGAPNVNKPNGQMAKQGAGGSDGAIPVKDNGDVAESKRYKLEKVKIKGRELDLDLDEDKLRRYVQQGYEANDRIQEAKRIEQENERKLAEYHEWKKGQEEHKRKFTSNPIQAAIEAGASPHQVREIAERWLLEQIQADEMSPDARRAKELEEKLAKREKEDAERQKKEEGLRIAQAAAEHRKQIVPEIIKHLDALGVARTAANIGSIAKRLKAAADRKTPMTIERAVQLTHEDNQAYIQSALGGQAKQLNEAYKANNFDAVMRVGREIESFLGEEALVALQRYGIVKWKSKTPSMPNQVFDTAKTKTVEEPRELTRDELLEERRRRAIELDRARQNRGAVTGP
jgi:hypothetical protein